jgi:DNA replication protein DnaC
MTVRRDGSAKSSAPGSGSDRVEQCELDVLFATVRCQLRRQRRPFSCQPRSALYQRVPKLFAELALARGDGRYARILRSLTGIQLLILDDWGLEPLDAGARRDLYEILEERFGRRSTILTSQIPVDKWHAFIGAPTYADAILDRLVHNAHRIDLAGESLRRRRSRSIPQD